MSPLNTHSTSKEQVKDGMALREVEAQAGYL